VRHTFTIPVPSSVWWVIGVLIAVFIVVLVLVVLPIVKFTVTLTSEHLTAYSPVMIKVTVRKSDVVGIKVVNLSEHPELKPTIRTFGVGLPGYKLGWFKLANGARAFLAVTSSSKAVVMELKDGTYVIITPKDLSEFLTALKELGWIR